MSNRPAISGVVLAGGRGRRMGGQDKGWVSYRGRPLVEWTIERLAPQVDELFISANRNLDRYAALGHPVLRDPLPDYPGPLAGILAALRRARHPLLLVVPCDTPAIPLDLAQRLHQALVAADAEIARVHDGRRWQPLHALLRTHLADDLAMALAGGERRLTQWQARHRLARADYADLPQAFCNLNDMTALQSST